MKSKLLFLTVFFVISIAATLRGQCVSPAISYFSPLSGAAGQTITINGTNFNSTPASNTVFFGSAKANVVTAAANQLTVTVPVGATYNHITVTNSSCSLTGYSPLYFNPISVCPGTFTASSVDNRIDYISPDPTYGPYGILFGDFDLDGKTDVMYPTGFGTSSGIVIARNQSVPGIIDLSSAITITSGAAQARNAAVADFDGDGKLDIVFVNNTGAQISVIRNTSSGPGNFSFASALVLTVSSGPYQVAADDIDGDGKPEIGVSHTGSNNVSVFRNTSTSGSVSFAARQDFDVATPQYAVGFADFNGDNKIELVATATGGGLRILSNTSTIGTISFSAFLTVTGATGYRLAIGDLNSDGYNDVVVANINGNGVGAFRNTSSGGLTSFAAGIILNTTTPNHRVAISDLNGDGKPDISTSYSGNNFASCLINTTASPGGIISVAAPITLTTTGCTYALGTADIDGDGNNDVLTGDWCQNRKLSVFRNNLLSSIPIANSVSPTSGLTCNSTITINYFAQCNGANPGNVYTAQLSDANGNFSIPVDIGSVTSTASGTITGTIPACIATGNGYRVRVVGSDPATTGTVYGTPLNIVCQTITPASITTSAVNPTTYCAGGTLNVGYTATGSFGVCGTNTFTAQLSDAGGSFASPINIGSLISNSSGTIAATIPNNLPSGASYRIRVVSNQPQIVGTNNGTNISISQPPVATITASGSTTLCSGNSITLTASPGSTWLWSTNETTQQITVNQTGNCSVTVTNAGGCNASANIDILATTPIVVTAVASNNATGAVAPQAMIFSGPGQNVTFVGQGPGHKVTGGRTNIYSNINTSSYGGLWWTFTPIENPRHSSQSPTGQMVFSGYDPATNIITFTSTANMIWQSVNHTENIATRLRMQLQPYTGTHTGPIATGLPFVTAGGISLGSLAANYPLIDIKALGSPAAYQVWYIIETASGVPLDVYYGDPAHNSSVGGTTETSQTGSFFSSTLSTCNGGPASVTVTATGGTGPYIGTGVFSATIGGHTYTVTDANGCSGSATITVVPPTPIVVTAVASNNATGAVAPQAMIFSGPGQNVTFAGQGPGAKLTGGRTNIYSNINTSSYGGLWWTFTPIENPRHSLQAPTGQMVFSGYDPATNIITFTSTANMIWQSVNHTENIATRLRMQLQPYTGTHTGPIATGLPFVTAGGISLGSLAANYPLIDIKALGSPAAYQVWYIIETASGVPLDVYYGDPAHNSSVGGTTETSQTGSFFSSTLSTCNGGPASVTVTATGGTGPYTGTGVFSATIGGHTYTVTDANGCSGSATITVTPPTPIVVTAVASNNATGAVAPQAMIFSGPGQNVTFVGQGPGHKVTGGRTNIYSNINTSSYGGLWWTFTPIENPRHSLQSPTGQMVFSSYDPVTRIITFTSTANMIWQSVNHTENIATRLRMQLQPYTGTHTGPIATGLPFVTAGGISLGSLAANYPLIDIKALGSPAAYQVWYIIETASGVPLDVYYGDPAHNSSVGGTTETSQTGSFFSSTLSTCNGGPASVTVTAIGGTGPYTGTGVFSAAIGEHTYTVTDANGCSGSATITVVPPTPIVVTAVASNNATGAAAPQAMIFSGPGQNVTFAGQGPGHKLTGGRTNIYSNINTSSYGGLWWTFTPIENPRHSLQSPTGQMVFSGYDPATNIITFTSTANMIWQSVNHTENIATRLRMQLQPYTGTHTGPIATGLPFVTAGGISLGSLAANYPLIDIKALGSPAAYQVWYIVETASGVPLDVYYGDPAHNSSVGGQTVTSQTGSFFSSTLSTCNGGPASVTVTATGGTGPYIGTGVFSAAIGEHTYTVTDANGCSGSATIDVEGQNCIELLCVENKTVSTDAGSCVATVMNIDPIITPPNAIVNYKIEKGGIELETGVGSVSGKTFAKGISTVTYTAADEPAKTCSFTVTVSDDEKPTFICPANQNINLNATCQLIVPNLIAGLTGSDNCGTVTFTQSPLAGASFAASHNQTQNVLITASDGNGNTQTCSVVLTGKDITQPTFNCPSNQNVNLNGSCQLIVPNLLAGLTGNDNCGTVTFTQSPVAGASLASSHNQTHNIVIMASDGNGNTSQCTVVLTGKDITSPTINCVSNISVNNDVGVCNAIVNYAMPTATDNCNGNGQATNVLLIWDEMNVNTNNLKNALTAAGLNVTLSATSETGYDGTNPSLAGFDAVIHLNGTTFSIGMPIAGQNALINFVLNQGKTYITDEWSAYEVDAGTMTTMRDIVVLLRSGGIEDVITYNAVPAQISHPILNSLPANFNLPYGGSNIGSARVYASNQPVVLMTSAYGDAVAVRNFANGGKAVGFQHSGNYNGRSILSDANVQRLYINAVKYGNGSSVTVAQIAGLPSGSSFPTGVTMNTFLATDAAGNTSTCSFSVTVTDNEKPTVTAPTTVDLECSSDLPSPATTITQFLGLLGSEAHDNCTGQAALLVSSNDGPLVNGNCNGTITRKYTITDATGNATTVNHVFTVTDNIKPTATAPATVDIECSSNLPAGKTTINGFLYLPGANANDNCTPRANLQVSFVDGPLVSGNCNGTITRTYTITDACGNATTVNHVFTITDNTKPTVTAPTTVDLECSSNLPAGKTTIDDFLSLIGANANDNCTPRANLQVSFVDGPLVSSNCNGSITRTYTITDACGNATTVNHVFTVTDNTKPTAVPPTTVDLECSSNLPPAKTTITDFLSLLGANANDNCTPQGSLLVSSVDGPLVGNNCYGTITRTYTITDACGNTTAVNHVFTVTDNTIPVINTCPGNGVTFIRNTNAGVCTYQVAGTEFNATGSDNCTGVTMSYSIINEHNPGTVTGTGSLAGKYLSFGLNTITWIATDGCGNTSSACAVKVDVDKITTTTTLTVNPTSQQYSDLVTFTATVTANNCTGAGNIGGTVTFKIGSLIIGTAPVINGVATVTDTLIEDMLYDANLNDPMNPTNGPLKPGAKTVTAYFSGTDADYIVTNPTAPLTVTCENADITYNGQTYFSVSPNTNAGTVVLSNYVVDKNDTPTGARGDIRNATATFWQNALNGSVLGTANVPVGLVNPTNKQEGFVTTSFNDVLSTTDISNGGKVYEVWSGLNNYYCENSDTYTPVTLGLPGQDFVTGGGYIVFGNNSAGTYAGTQGKRMNFGFVMKWNSSGKNLQGRVNVVYRKMVNGVQRIYQIKSNAINSLVVENVNDAGSPATGTSIKFRRATISTKANLADITDPLNPISLGGNLSLTLIAWESTTVATGALDRINVQLSGTGSIGLLFSSNWVSGNTSWQTLNGGKIQVRNPSTPAPGQRTTTSEEIIITKTTKLHLLIKAFPNPSENYFNLMVEGNRNEDVVVSVYNVNGVRIHQAKGTANRYYKFGEGWIPGTYLVEVRQGNELKAVKLIKQ